jgi:hypothetical protein
MNQKLEWRYIALIRELAEHQRARASARSEVAQAFNSFVDRAIDLHADLLASGYGK